MSLNVKEQKSIAGLRANAVAFLVNISFFMGIGLIFSIFALIMEPENKFVRNYSRQTLSLCIILLVSSLLNIIVFIGTVIFIIFTAVIIILQIVATVNSALGKEFEIPYIKNITNLLFV